jgi:UDP-glucose 4-epimerase
MPVARDNTQADNSEKKPVALVTGGLGFIGRNLTRRLLDEGWVVHVVDDCSNSSPDNLEEGAFLEIASVTDLPSMIACFKNIGPDFVFHLAALPRIQFSIDHPVETHHVNVTGTMNVLVAAERCGTVRKLVYSSSSSVYGDQVKMPIGEDAPLNPKSPYAVQKHVGEQYLKAWATLYGLPTVSLRYFSVYGPHQSGEGPYALAVARFFGQFKEGAPFTITGDGMQTRDFTHVSDVVEANLLAALVPEARSGQVFNIGYGRAMSVNGIADLIGGKEYPRTYIEARLEPRETQAENTLSRVVLGWSPKINIEEGIRMLKEAAPRGVGSFL